MGYVTLDRLWKTGDTIALDLPIETRRVVADAKVADARRRVAIERGPLVYCLEWPDTDGGHALDALVESSAPLQASVDKSLYGGVTVIETRASRVSKPSVPAATVKLIPYYLWANRGAGEMTVWL